MINKSSEHSFRTSPWTPLADGLRYGIVKELRCQDMPIYCSLEWLELTSTTCDLQCVVSLASGKQRKWIPVNSKVAYLDSRVLPIATPPVVFMEKCENDLRSFAFINAYNSSISLTAVYKKNIFRAVCKYRFVLYLASQRTVLHCLHFSFFLHHFI